MTDATELDEAAIRARLEAATPGPWRASGLGTWVGFDDKAGFFRMFERSTWATDADAEFIAHARTDVGLLLAALDEARAEVGRLSGPFPCCVHCQEDPVHAVDRDEHSVECRTCGTGAEARALAAESALAAVKALADELQDDDIEHRLRAALATPTTTEEPS